MTSTQTLNRVDVDVDIEFVKVCERQAIHFPTNAVTAICDNPVEWLEITGCCQRLILVCDQHHRWPNSILGGLRPSGFVTCRGCGYRHKGWDNYIARAHRI